MEPKYWRPLTDKFIVILLEQCEHISAREIRRFGIKLPNNRVSRLSYAGGG